MCAGLRAPTGCGRPGADQSRDPERRTEEVKGMCGTLTSLSDGHSGQWRACNAVTVSCAATASNSATKRIPDNAGGMASAR